ncbi:hypothetical protein LEP1GSC058_2764 [Leptospira fainei serovar Hurstbridge str. BUT 6]|uniref:Uncharacterized protein n=1 Tax=Leptospira fainei serovar Hurstbridge str. BUT 6 TaxID=1193011 RepID=S3VA89_9LEPT|nr:hypothetical protein LEP1GSC058_2764 [Leptospira fainei serovar Hurstbridge str. BUT 6]
MLFNFMFFDPFGRAGRSVDRDRSNNLNRDNRNGYDFAWQYYVTGGISSFLRR